MNNPALAHKLEGYPVDPPSDYETKIMNLVSPRTWEFSDAIVHNVAGMKETSGKKLNALHIVGVMVATIGKMAQAKVPKPQILAALDIAPKFLAILITDTHVCDEATSFFNGEFANLRYFLTVTDELNRK